MPDKIEKRAIIDVRLETEKARKQAEMLRISITKLEDEQKRLKKALDTAITEKSLVNQRKYAKELTNVQTKLKRARTEFNQYSKEVNRGNEIFKRSGGFTKSLTTALTSMALQVISVYGAYRLLNTIVKGSIKNFADFETGILNIQGLLDQFDETLERRSIKLMTTYGLKMEDVTKAMFDAVSAGIPAAELMEFMAASAKLAISGVTDLTTATRAIFKAINVYGLELDKANEIADMFFTTQKKGVTTVQLVADNFGKAAVVAKGAGIEFEEFMATFAGLTKVMDSTEETTTILKNVINALIAPGKQAEQVFKDLKIETGLTALQQNGLFNTFEKIIQATKDDNDAITELFPNVRALTGALALNEEKMREMHEVYELVKTDIGETSSATKIFEKHMDSLNKRMDITKAKIKEQSIAIGQELKPAWLLLLVIFEKIIETMRFMVTLGGSMTDDMREEIEEKNDAIQKSEIKTTSAALKANLERAKIIDDFTAKTKIEIGKLYELMAMEPPIRILERIIPKTEEFIADRTEYYALLREMQTDVIDIEEQTKKELNKIGENYDEKEKEKEKAKALYKENLTKKIVDTALMAGNALIAMNRNRMEKEIELAGDNEEKIAEIRKKYAKKEQLISIAQTIISGAEGIVKTGANLGYPQAIPFQILQGLQTLAQIVIIKAQKFAKGGMTDFKEGILKGIGTWNSDNIIGALSPGEIILNAKVGANPILRAQASAINIAGGGVPFADGGMAARSISTEAEQSLISASQIRSIVESMPPQIVLVKDITTGIERVVSVEERANI